MNSVIFTAHALYIRGHRTGYHNQAPVSGLQNLLITAHA